MRETTLRDRLCIVTPAAVSLVIRYDKWRINYV